MSGSALGLNSLKQLYDNKLGSLEVIGTLIRLIRVKIKKTLMENTK